MAALPTTAFLMLATEGRYHYDWLRQRRPDARIIWRAIPRIGKRPAELGWSPKKMADECLNLVHEASLPLTDFLPLNEPDLNSERGDQEDDFSNLEHRYALLGGFLLSLIPMLRDRLPTGCRVHFPAFTPDHQALDYVDHWRSAAEASDSITIHAYDTLDKIRRHYQAYRAAFPNSHITFSEWHGLGNAEEERRIMEWFALTMLDDPLFDATHRFIWEWFDYPDWWSPDFDVVHNPAMRRLFEAPPVIVPVIDAPSPEPDPVLPPPEPVPPHTPDPEPTVPSVTDMPRGIDVASYQGRPDWAAVAASGVQFAITKATESVGYVNPTFAYNWSGIKAAGMIRGAYHFGRPSANGAVTEAEFFCNHVESVGLDTGDLVVLDLEDTNASGDLGPWVLEWVHHVESRLGYKPMIYTGGWFSDPHGIGNYPEIGTYGLWIAAYQAAMPSPPAPWPVVAIWQWTDNLTVSGIAGTVDGDRYNGDISTLKLYGKPAAPPAPHTYSVGQGLANKMAALGDTPASDETFLDLWSEAVGQSGIRYVYWKGTGEITVYPPVA